MTYWVGALVRFSWRPEPLWGGLAGKRNFSLYMTLSLLLSGCGGGGSDSGNSVTNGPGVELGAATQSATPTAYAGEDQDAVESSTVQLVGSGTGRGGLSYAWRQVSGSPQVQLNNADQAVASFLAPDVAADAPRTLVFELTVEDGSGNTVADQVSITVHEPPPQVLISGNLKYEYVPAHSYCPNGLNYSATEQRPIRGATVQVLDASSKAVLATTRAGPDGSYSVTVPGGRQVFVRVRAELKQSGAPGWDVEVRNNTANTASPLEARPLYVLDGAAFGTVEDQIRNLAATTGWVDGSYKEARSAAPFAILDTIYSSMDLVLSADPTAVFPPLDAFWSVNNSTATSGWTDVDGGNIGNSFYSPDMDSLFLLGKENEDTEEFDSHVIAHEWGHYFEDTFSRSDSIGGPHSLGQRLDPRLAHGEGWATALAGMILNNPNYCDTSGNGQSAGFGISMESTSVGRRGWFNEVSIAAVFYDLWDSGVLDDDGFSIGFKPIYDTFVSDQPVTPALVSIFSFASALKSRAPDRQVAIDALLAQHGITAQDAWATGETNDSENGAALDVLPVYTTLQPGSSLAEPICSTDHYDSPHDGNKLSVFRYLRVPISVPGRYRIRVANANPPTSKTGTAGDGDSDPDFLLYRQGTRVHVSNSGTANIEESTTPILSVGDHVLTVGEFRYADKDTYSSFPERSCFDVTINPAP